VALEIRTAVVEDLPALRAVFRAASLANAGDRAALLAHPDALVLDHANVAAGRTRGACEAGQVVGFATVLEGGEEVELEDLFVEPAWMRRGVATALVRDALERAHEAGARRLAVTANDHALAFYLACGFVEAGRVATAFGEGRRMWCSTASPASGTIRS
jgi:GNAT superfamily N-acetyltransferase